MKSTISAIQMTILAVLCCCNFSGRQTWPSSPAPESIHTALPSASPRPATAISSATAEIETTPAAVVTATSEAPSSLLPYLQASSLEGWTRTVKDLSGVQPVTVNGVSFFIKTRISTAMFDPVNTEPAAFDYLLVRIQELVPSEYIAVETYTFFNEENKPFEWRNIIVTFPGKNREAPAILLTAHFDSTTLSFNKDEPAPGADDNASGTAGLMEALKVFSGISLNHPVKLIFFSGEEFGLLGSAAYLRNHPVGRGDQEPLAVINLDVISYDPNHDFCADAHVGSLQSSGKIAEIMQQVIRDYDLKLMMEYLYIDALPYSDHGSFWDQGIGAVMLSANLVDGKESDICEPAEFNPYMHTDEDIFSNIAPQTGYEITRLAILTILEMDRTE